MNSVRSVVVVEALPLREILFEVHVAAIREQLVYVVKTFRTFGLFFVERVSTPPCG
jgi:hypothetical protein